MIGKMTPLFIMNRTSGAVRSPQPQSVLSCYQCRLGAGRLSKAGPLRKGLFFGIISFTGVKRGQQRSSCAVIYSNNSATLSVDLNQVHTYSNFQSICQAPDLSSPNSITHFHSPSSSYAAATAGINVNRNNPIAATPPFYLENRQQSAAATSSSYFDSQILLEESRQPQLVNLQQVGGAGGVCQIGHPAITGVNNLDQLIDLDICKDVDDELINKELEYLYNNSNNMGGNFDPLATNSSIDGHHNPLDQFLRDSTNQFYDEDEYYFSPERKRHLTAPGSLNFSSTNNRANNNYLVTNNNEAHSISTPKLIASDAEEFMSLAFDANNEQSGGNATAFGIAENASSNVSQNRDNHLEEANLTTNNDRQLQNHHHLHRHIQKSKTRPTSRNRRKSRGKPDNVFALLNSVLAKKQLQLSISPVRFRKQKFAPVVDHRPARPAPLIIPGPNTFNKFHSQLRSPRLWQVDPHSSSSSSGGFLDVGNLTSFFTPYTPPPILSPMRKGSGLFWRISLAACGGVSGAKSAPISPRCRREFWKKVTTPQKEAIFGQTIANIDSSDCGQSINDGTALENGVEIPETDTNPHINVGSKYQAWIGDNDDVRPFDRYADHTLHKADLMFDPFYAEDRDEDELNAYMEFASSNAIFGSAPNKEYALHLLHCTRGDLEKSVVLLMDHRTAYTNFGNYTYVDSDSWSCEEIQQFQDALFKHDKDFFLVASTIGTKTVKQCVAFYYTWKKIYSDENRRLKSLRRRRDLSDVNNGAYYNLRAAAATAAPTSTTAATGEKSLDDVDYSTTNNVSKIVSVIEDHSPEFRTNELTYRATPVSTVSPSVTVHKRLNFDEDDQEIKMENEKISNIIEENDDRDSLLTTDDFSSSFKINDVSAEEIVEQTRPKRTNTNRDGYFPCRLCGKIFYKIKSRNAHMKSHSDKVPKKKKDN
uniref:Transcriptional-regulating factor 1 n=1 Tax=Romanomermis culicivorax TaxID=13658 RepID=A0A915IWT9_ROMCU